MNQNTKSIVLASVAVLSWSTVATAFKIALRQLSTFEMLLIATATSLLIFAVLLTIERKWGELRHIPNKMWAYGAVMGFVNPVAYYLILFQAYDMLPAQVAQPANYLWPIVLLVLLAVFNRQPIAPKKYIGMTVSLVGLTLVSFGGKSVTGYISPVGLALGLGSAFLWATYWLLNEKFKGVVSESVGLFLGFLFGMVYLLIGMIFVPVNIPSTSALLSGIYIGAFEMGIPFVCFGLALRRTSNPALINQLCYLAPFMSLFFISMVLGESISPATLLGLSLIVGGIVYNQYFAQSRGVVTNAE